MSSSIFKKKVKKEFLEQNKVVLIVTEGTDTEILYFKELRKALRIPTLLVEVIPAKHSDPLHVVNYAISLYEKGYSDKYGKRYNSRDFDEIYVVVDTDCHENLSEALSAIDTFNNKSRKTKIHQIISCPCFELWFLLHFVNICPKEMSQNDVHFQLMKILPKYSKSYNVYPLLKDKTEIAINRAEQVKNNKQFENDCYTDVYKLILVLEKYSETYEKNRTNE